MKESQKGMILFEIIKNMEVKMKKENIVIEKDLLKFSVDTINLNVTFADKESVQTIDNHWFISYKADNSKEDELTRTITLKPDSMKKNTPFLKDHLSEEKIETLQESSFSNLMKLINLFEKDKRITKVNEVRRIDFKFDLLKPYEDILQLNKMLLLCHNYSKNKEEQNKKGDNATQDEEIPYKNNIIRTEGYLSSGKNTGRSILNNKGHIDICFYNKKKQLMNYLSLNEDILNTGIESRLEYRFIKNNLEDSKSHSEVIRHQLERLKKMLLKDRKNVEKIESALSEDIIKNYDDSNLKEYRSKLSNFLIAFNKDILTDQIMKNLYNHSNLYGDLNNYLDKFKRAKYKKNPFVFVSETQLINYTVTLRRAITNYLKG
jgi:hypothetical protein